MKLLRNPLFLFIILGLAAFILYSWLKPDNKEEIRVTSQIVADLVAQDEALNLKSPDEERIQELIENYIQEEIMLREAFELGYHTSDGRVRKRLLNLMRTSLQDQIPEPSYNQLQAYFEENIQEYSTGETRTFLQIYYDPSLNEDIPDLTTIKTQYADYLGEERAGDFAPVSNRQIQNSYELVGRTFGKEIADAVFSAELNQWFGPMKSTAGLHYIKVLEVYAPEEARFEDVESFVSMDYVLKKTRESQDEKIELLRPKYHIVIEGDEN